MTTARSSLPTYFRTSAGQWTVAGACLLLFVALAWPQRVPSLTTANDDATYVLLSRSVLDGGYNSVHLVGEPIHTKYPPAFPVLLAGESLVAGESTNVFAAVNVAVAAAALALLFAVARHRLPPSVAFGALAMSASNPFLQGSAGTVMSEPMFMALIALTLWVLARPPQTTASLTLACACATLAALTRTVGATLVLAVLALLVLERRWRPALVYAGILAAIVLAASLWLLARGMPQLAADYITDALDAGGDPSLNPVTVIGRRIAHNATGYAGSLLWLVAVPTVRGTIVDNALWLGGVTIALAAGLWLFWRRWRIVTVFLLIYGFLILAWPWAVGRFLVPLLPLLGVAILAGAHFLVERWRPTAAPAVTLALAAIIAVTGIARSASRIGVRSKCDRADPMRSARCFNADQLSFFAAARWVGEHTPPSTVVMSANEGTFFYLAHRHLVPIDSINSRPRERAAAFLRRENVSYVILNHAAYDDVPFSARLMSACEHLEPVEEFPPRTVVFRVLPRPSPDSRACEILEGYSRESGRFLPQVF
jgi:dolichyl-phosphate-mannose-protein mannosyltransferase